MEVGDEVKATIQQGSWSLSFAGIVRELHRNTDGELNGIARVEITEPGNTWHKAGALVDVGTIALTVRQ